MRLFALARWRQSQCQADRGRGIAILEAGVGAHVGPGGGLHDLEIVRGNVVLPRRHIPDFPADPRRPRNGRIGKCQRHGLIRVGSFLGGSLRPSRWLSIGTWVGVIAFSHCLVLAFDRRCRAGLFEIDGACFLDGQFDGTG